METALLTAKPHLGRAMLSRVFLMVVLGALFFGLFWVDLALLGASIPNHLFEIVAAGLFVLLALDLVASFVRLRRTTYAVFADRMAVLHDQEEVISVPHYQVDSFTFSRSTLDKACNTIQLKAGGKRFPHLPNENQFLFQLQKVIQQGKQQYRPAGKKRAW
jgi:hypothetical protein